MRNIIVIVAGLTMLLTAVIVTAQDKPADQPKDSIETAANQGQESGQVVVYYLHMNRRCMTCRKLEAYSKEAISDGFAEQLKAGAIIWRVENFEKEGNEHFAKDYQLYSQSLILSRQHDGKETEWKNLDKIWNLVGDREQFISYVQTEVEQFMNPAEEE